MLATSTAARGVAPDEMLANAASSAVTENVATASRLEAKMFIKPVTVSPPKGLASEGGTSSAKSAAASAMATPNAAYSAARSHSSRNSRCSQNRHVLID